MTPKKKNMELVIFLKVSKMRKNFEDNSKGA